MKKILTALSALLLLVTASYAQSSQAILETIRAGIARHTSVSGPMTEIRTPALTDAPIVTLKGTLEYKAPDKVDIEYTNGEYFRMEGSTMVINRDGKVQTFDLTKNIMMKNLSHTLLYSFQGLLPDLAAENNADILATREGKTYCVTLTARKKAVRGCSKIIARYSAADCSLIEMQIEEFTGIVTFYSLGN